MQTLEAVFENGVFRPLAPLDEPISEGQQVRLVVETPDSAQDVLELAMRVFDGLPEEQVDEIEQIILDRRDFFSKKAQ